MGKKKYYLIVDTETTQADTVADFGAVVMDRHGNIVNECAVLVRGHFGVYELFHDVNSADEIWTLKGLERRKNAYAKMLNEGSRMLATPAAINRWLEKVNATYSPELTAYNLAFDLGKCANTGIDLDLFDKRFCMWQAAFGNWALSRKYKQFILDNHYFGAVTKYGNMSYKTKAETMAHFVTGQHAIEPHTALEDAKHFERHILVKLLKTKKWREKTRAFNWRELQVKDNFRV